VAPAWESMSSCTATAATNWNSHVRVTPSRRAIGRAMGRRGAAASRVRPVRGKYVERGRERFELPPKDSFQMSRLLDEEILTNDSRATSRRLQLQLLQVLP
jgi:hypothetical protein